MSLFPLGDKIFQIATQKSEPANLPWLVTQLGNTTQEQRDHLGLLLIHYYYSSGGTGDPFRSQKRSDLPYDLKTNSVGKGCSFEPTVTPPLALQGLAAYLGA